MSSSNAWSKQFQYRVNRTEMIKQVIIDYVDNGMSHRLLKSKYNLSERTLTYIIHQYIEPKYHRGSVVKRLPT